MVSESVIIERPPEDVFAYVTDPQNLPEWGNVIREVRKETEGSPRVGKRYTVDAAFLGRRWEQSFEVTVYEPPRHYSDRNMSGAFHDEHAYTFEEAGGGGTRLTVAMGPRHRPQGPDGGSLSPRHPLPLDTQTRRGRVREDHYR